MFLIVGYIIILAASLGTYAVHGSLLALWVPLEYIAIIGLTIGGFVAGNDIKYIKKTVGALPSIFKGSKFTKALYVDLLNDWNAEHLGLKWEVAPQHYEEIRAIAERAIGEFGLINWDEVQA